MIPLPSLRRLFGWEHKTGRCLQVASFGVQEEPDLHWIPVHFTKEL